MRDVEKEKWRRLFDLARAADQEIAQLRILRDVLRDLPGQAIFVVDSSLRIRACGGEILSKHPQWSINALNGFLVEDMLKGPGLNGSQGLEILNGYRKALAGQDAKVIHRRLGVVYISRFWPIMHGSDVVCVVACTFLGGTDPAPVDLSALEEGI